MPLFCFNYVYLALGSLIFHENFNAPCVHYCLATVCRTEKEMNRRRDMVDNLRSKVIQMASTLNMSNFANRDSLLGPEIKPADAMSRASGLDNQGVVGLQRQIMRG